MHSTACTARHAQHGMHSTTRTALHAQHHLHSTHCMHSTHYMHSTTCTANPGQRSSSDRGGQPKKGVAWVCREENSARKAHKVCIWCAKEGHIGKDFVHHMHTLCAFLAAISSLQIHATPFLGLRSRRGALHAQHLLSIACTPLRQQCMYSTACAAQCHTQHYLHSIMSCTALCAQHNMLSPA